MGQEYCRGVDGGRGPMDPVISPLVNAEHPVGPQAGRAVQLVNREGQKECRCQDDAGCGFVANIELSQGQWSNMWPT